MAQQHPITPPPELVQQWTDEYIKDKPACAAPEFIATRSAQWGSDQELEACCAWVSDELSPDLVDELHAARRPKPQSLKEQALELAKPAGTQGAYVTFGPEELGLIRRALEQLPDAQ